MKLFFFICLTCFSFCAAAQIGFTVSGRIVSQYKEDQEDLTSDIFQLINTEGKFCGGVVDSNGYFKFHSIENGKYRLHITAFILRQEIDTSIEIKGESIENLIFEIKFPCSNCSEIVAARDIKNKKPRLISYGFYWDKNKKEIAFQKKYHVKYDCLGCMRPDHGSCIVKYNNAIFKYLDKKYGQGWRKEVNKQVIGFHN